MNHWRIIKPGLSTTFQDAGRFHQAHLGIPVSGALDIPAARYANKLLNNDLNQPALEVTLTGLSFQTSCNCSIALTGAVFICSINSQTIDHEQTINLKAGDIFSMNKKLSGARAYLAVAGGFDIPLILDSASTLESAKLGGFHGRALQTDDLIELNTSRTTATRQIATWKRPQVKAKNTSKATTRTKTIHVIRALPGPEFDLFDAFSQQSIWQQAFEVTQDSNRMGMRLHNTHDLQALKTITSTGLVPGSLQVTPNGDSIMTLNDGQVTGGYPRIIVALANQLPLLAQALPGDLLYFYKETRPS